MSRRGQALVELAVCLPVLLLLGLGSAQLIRLAIARTGLDAATAAAAAAASRAPSSAAASVAGRAAFDRVAAGYRLDPTTSVTIGSGDFRRGGTVVASAHTVVNLGLGGFHALGVAWSLSATASARVEDWRSRPTGR